MKGEKIMNEYRIKLCDGGGNWQYDHIRAATAQEAVDRIRAEYKGRCYVARVSLVLNDWQ